ncbi:antiviral reverse transcriptase Drt3a, partial [Bacteroides sp. KG156]|uniref:antiviral reverse transcriptase Drt3a n=1 Tax=unclassified Bacteroides TaxID=2646097 RepID=UPI003D9760AC
MLDQSFSYDTISTVFMQSNRKGQVKKEFLSVEYLEAAKEYRSMRHTINTLKKKSKNQRSQEDENAILELEALMKDNAARQKELLRECLSKIAENINKREFRFTLTPKESDDPNKPNYVIGKTAEEFFAMKILCKNLKHTFNLQMSSRNNLLHQVKQLLKEDKHPKYIIRTDIQHCFESIPHEQLFELIENNTLLDYKNKTMLKGLICNEFEHMNLRCLVSQTNTGIPRGCAISSFLAELYLSKIDKQIKEEIGEIAYYNRYVDDIIIIIHPSQIPTYKKSINDYKCTIEGIFNQKGLTLSKEKTQLIKSFGNPVYSIEILGYEFVVKGNNVEIQHTKVKNEKMYKRLDAVFTRFDKLLKCDYKSAKSYLFDALRILTANTNL